MPAGSGQRGVVIWGARGHCRVLADILVREGRSLAATADHDPVEPPIPAVPLLAGRGLFQEWLADQDVAGLDFLVAIGGARGRDRLEIAGWLSALGIAEGSVRHQSAILEPSACAGPGLHALAGSVIGANARLGRQCILNTRASVDHDCVLGDGVHLAPGATVCGEVQIGTRAFVAAGATVLPKLRIGADAVIGAGAVVVRDVPAGAMVLGVPAREVRPHG